MGRDDKADALLDELEQLVLRDSIELFHKALLTSVHEYGVQKFTAELVEKTKQARTVIGDWTNAMLMYHVAELMAQLIIDVEEGGDIHKHAVLGTLVILINDMEKLIRSQDAKDRQQGDTH